MIFVVATTPSYKADFISLETHALTWYINGRLCFILQYRLVSIGGCLIRADLLFYSSINFAIKISV